MFLTPYITRQGEEFSFSRAQASNFAKKIASDFNPLHDEDAKRFCVPGDLMFAWFASQYGISEQLCCTFSGMVASDIWLHFSQQGDEIHICDRQDKVYLSLRQQGKVIRDEALIESIVTDYVRFSGQNFPHILQPLMQQHDVMIHTQRPMVIYESMALHLDQLPTELPDLALTQSSLEVTGRRGNVALDFSLSSHGKSIGHGRKHMILSNLSPYDGDAMQAMINEYDRRKALFFSA
ncbi:DUF3581 family protein [Alkalimonas collagenimarina]|uniref:DUF3581 family protein n=1 Tax=Alkalimonas collagenimarina TaxID=400390 RepID=A0ABT9H098_9GAMM|nr:DUF3581 family protein [Alkalimonas collagenimarina]MDP4536746.1 DUF3581 family protein [Alkalimonas collagenimarina]